MPTLVRSESNRCSPCCLWLAVCCTCHTFRCTRFSVNHKLWFKLWVDRERLYWALWARWTWFKSGWICLVLSTLNLKIWVCSASFMQQATDEKLDLAGQVWRKNFGLWEWRNYLFMWSKLQPYPIKTNNNRVIGMAFLNNRGPCMTAKIATYLTLVLGFVPCSLFLFCYYDLSWFLLVMWSCHVAHLFFCLVLIGSLVHVSCSDWFLSCMCHVLIGWFLSWIRIRIRKRFIAKCSYTHKEFVLETEASSAQTGWQVTRHR